MIGGVERKQSGQGFPMNDWVVQSGGAIVAVNIQVSQRSKTVLQDSIDQYT